MNQRKDIYCEKSFWSELSQKLSEIKNSPDFEERRNNQDLDEWYDLLGRSNVFFDCSEEVIVELSKKDCYLEGLLIRSGENRCSVDFLSGAVTSMCKGSSQMNTKMYNSLYLSKESHVAQARNVGIINIGSNDLHSNRHLFNDFGPSVGRDTERDWAQMLDSAKANQNCNSMIIVDKYIFKDVNANLYRILNTLLPKKLGTMFYLSIFSLDGCEESEIERFKQRLDEKIRIIRPELSFFLEVYGCCIDDFHDRGIITNYLWIEIGAGFNLIKKGLASKTTNIHVIYPMIVSEERIKCSSEGYWNIIEDAKRYLRIRGMWSNNRLLRE